MNGSRRLSPQEIADILRERIRNGDLKAGDRLPTQAELADEFGVERGAVRQALRVLQEAGLLTNVSKGSPPRIAVPAPAVGGTQRTRGGAAPPPPVFPRSVHQSALPTRVWGVFGKNLPKWGGRSPRLPPRRRLPTPTRRWVQISPSFPGSVPPASAWRNAGVCRRSC